MGLDLSSLGAIRDELVASEAADPIAVERNRRNQEQAIIDEGMKPWTGYDPSSSSPSYYGMNARDWLDSEAEMMQNLDRHSGHMDYVNPNARQVQELTRSISRDYGISQDEALRNLQRVVGSQGGDLPMSLAVDYGVPSAHADEKMSRAALELSGFDDVRQINDQMVQATDLRGMLDGRPINIDAQKHLTTANLMQLGALQNVESRRNIDAELRQMPGSMSVMEALRRLQMGSRGLSDGQMTARSPEGDYIDVSGNEDKLMQSSNQRFNPNQSETYQRNEAALRKDGLIWTDRSGYRPDQQEFFGRGPFDAAQARDMSLVDLEAMRDYLSNTALEQMDAEGLQLKSRQVPRGRRRLSNDARNRGNQLSDVKLVLPKRLMRNMGGNLPRLAGTALQAFTTAN